MKKLLLIIGISLETLSCSKNATNPNRNTSTVNINGSSYATVVIGKQTWTAQNYDGPEGTASPRGDEGFVGKYYLLGELKGIVLPPGWRIPSQSDFKTLFKSQGVITDDQSSDLVILDSAGTSHLRANSDWLMPGDDKSGFNAFGAGFYNAYQNSFPDATSYTYFWTSTPGTNTVEPPSQCIAVIAGYYSSPGTGSIPFSSAALDPTSGVLNLGYNLRFVKDN